MNNIKDTLFSEQYGAVSGSLTKQIGENVYHTVYDATMPHLHLIITDTNLAIINEMWDNI